MITIALTINRVIGATATAIAVTVVTQMTAAAATAIVKSAIKDSDSWKTR